MAFTICYESLLSNRRAISSFSVSIFDMLVSLSAILTFKYEIFPPFSGIESRVLSRVVSRIFTRILVIVEIIEA